MKSRPTFFVIEVFWQNNSVSKISSGSLEKERIISTYEKQNNIHALNDIVDIIV